MRSWISSKDYATFAGVSWPTYEDFLSGINSDDPAIHQEIQQFVQKMEQYHSEIIKSGNDIAIDNQQRQRQVFFDKHFHQKPHCNVPWNTVGIQPNGDVFICLSPSWIPKFVGNVLQTDDIFDILNSDMARSIRREILAGRYLYCNNSICGFFQKIPPGSYETESGAADPLPDDQDPRCLIHNMPGNWIFDFDFTCNLKCPSCRNEVINTNKHTVIRPINDRITNFIKHNMIDRVQDQIISVRWCGGEPFISEPYLDILEYIRATKKTNIQNVIQTNGSYLRSKSDLVLDLLPSISELRISFDAATEETYRRVRINGQWTRLLDNTKWIVEQIRHRGTSTKVSADFVVQKTNYREIPQFVELCHRLDIKHINWQKMWNWGTWSMTEFDEMNVYRRDHPAYPEIVTMLQQHSQSYSEI